MKKKNLARLLRLSKNRVLLIVAVLVGFSVGYFVSPLRYTSQSTADKREQYNLLAQRILVERPNDVLIDFRVLQNQIETFIAQNSLEGKISLYFEYLPTGSSIGIDETEKQVGASLLKLPLAMSVYKESEKGNVTLDKRLPIQENWLNNSFGELYKKGAGYELSTREATKEALINSDNTAALLMFDQVAQAQRTQTPNLLGFIDANYAETPTHEILIDSRSYSSILKCLYFSCFLNKDNSQEILQYLTQSNANNRLRKYIPESIQVAHKIGTFNQQTQSDCGIFYLPERQYVLCIMVDEADPEASGRIADISRIVYNYLSAGSN